VSPAELRRAAAVCPVSAIQMEYSLQSRDIEPEVIPTARELGIGIVAYSPLGRGILSKTFASTAELSETDWRRTQPRMEQSNLQANLSAADRLAEAAKTKGIPPATLAIAWVLAQGSEIFVIPGSKAVVRLEQNVAGAHVALSAEEAASLAALVGDAVGERYDARSSASTFNARV
jgi:aryl-alcohol dehydrogenase-like predicted oxidoreductase